jgi:di/tricarboxylate transporter
MFDPAGLAIAALVLVVVVSCTTRVNAGLLAIVLAWLIGVSPPSLCERPVGLRVVVGGFPSGLFLTLTGVTLLFALVRDNGTLDRVARRAVLACGNRPALVPVLFFALAATVGTAGAGNIAAAALVAPAAMGTARRLGIPAFPMALMVAHGAIAGGMSPFGPAGVVVAAACRDRFGMPGAEWALYGHNFLANAAVGFAGFALFGGLRRRAPLPADAEGQVEAGPDASTLYGRHRATLFILGLVAATVVGLGADVGMAAFAGSVVLIVFRLADESRAVQSVPWGVILMVCGVSTLVAVLEQTGGTDRLAELLARVATPATAPALVALACGVVSVYSSTTGVVLPAFLPLVPGLVGHLGGDPLVLASAVVVGGNVADASPLSTIGALCLASAGAGEDRRRLFNRLLAWGLTMPLVAAAGYGLVTAARGGL